MSYRSTRGSYNSRSTRSSAAANDASYTSAAYSTQASYQTTGASQQSPQVQNPAAKQFTTSASYKPVQTVTAVKPEYDTQMKTADYQASAGQAKPAAAQPGDTSMQQDEEKPWKKRTFNKLPKKIKKKRMNAKLRHLLAPKNAMMVLHELHPGLECTTNEEPGPTGQMSYTVVIDIDGKQYRGQGLSKVQAKQTACENALKAALYEKMVQSNIKSEPGAVLKTETEPAAAAMETENETSTNGEGQTKTRKPPEEDDVPWGSLASYALFKLFSEWQAQGYSLPTSATGKLPVFKGTLNQGMSQWGYSEVGTIGEQPTSQMPMKKLPEDASSRHPVQLLNQMKPHAQYFEHREGNPPNMVFSFTVTFDGQTYSGNGPNKKEAKKACAKAALISLGINYNDAPK